MQRVILHVDMNNFYASVECFLNPKLRDQAVAVCGDADMRHGIILAKNQLAKKCGVKTGEAIWQATLKCPKLVCIKANYKNYVKFSNLARGIYLRYTNKMEPFGLDEAWLDISSKYMDIQKGEEFANNLRDIIKKELGITASVGVSFNKVFAKLASDMQKPDATTVISKENFKSVIWRLPASDLLYVGRSTKKKLEKKNIITIGDLAKAKKEYLKSFLGKWGETLYLYANGLETSEVLESEYKREIKSVGNSSTTKHDLTTITDVKNVLYSLSENVAMRLKKYCLQGSCVQLYVRKNTLEYFTRQAVLGYYTDLTKDIYNSAMGLFLKHCDLQTPIRSMGVRCTKVVSTKEKQLNMFEDLKNIQIENAIEQVRRRFGSNSVLRGTVLLEQDLAELGEERRSIFPQNNL